VIRINVLDRAGFSVSEGSFGLINPREDVRKEIGFYTCELPGMVPCKLVSVETNSEQLAVETDVGRVEAFARQAIKRNTNLHLRLSPGAVPGLSSADVTVTYLDDGRARQATIHVRWNVRSLFSISPARAFFGDVGNITKPIERPIYIQREDGEPLTIRNIRSSCTAVAWTLNLDGARVRHSIVLSLDPTKLEEALWDEVIVETDHPLQPIVKIPFAAYRRLQ
jgi:hypothetical protein